MSTISYDRLRLALVLCGNSQFVSLNSPVRHARVDGPEMAGQPTDG